MNEQKGKENIEKSIICDKVEKEIEQNNNEIKDEDENEIREKEKNDDNKGQKEEEQKEKSKAIDKENLPKNDGKEEDISAILERLKMMEQLVKENNIEKEKLKKDNELLKKENETKENENELLKRELLLHDLNIPIFSDQKDDEKKEVQDKKEEEINNK